MGLTVGLREALGRDVRLDLRAVQARVAEHLLHDAQICPAVEQVGGRTVPQRVRPFRPAAGLLLELARYQPVYCARSELVATVSEKYRAGVATV